MFYISNSLRFIWDTLYCTYMKEDLSQKVLPVAFSSHNGRLWVEFSDGHLQGFRVDHVADATTPSQRPVPQPSKKAEDN